jgi:hypothetical protein
MPLLVRAEDRVAPGRGLAAWRVVTWLLLLFAAIGGVQYIHHGSAVWQELQRWPADDSSGHVAALHRMLAWDAAYLAAAFVIIVACAGVILRQGWSRSVLRVVSVLLALWALVSGLWLASAMRALLPPDATSLSQMAALLPHSYLLALAMKAVAAVLLLWLAWRLGRADVRARFIRRR